MPTQHSSYTLTAESPNRVDPHTYQRIREEVDANIQSLGGVTRRQRKKMLGRAVAEFLARPVVDPTIKALPVERRPRPNADHYDPGFEHIKNCADIALELVVGAVASGKYAVTVDGRWSA